MIYLDGPLSPRAAGAAGVGVALHDVSLGDLPAPRDVVLCLVTHVRLPGLLETPVQQLKKRIKKRADAPTKTQMSKRANKRTEK